ncbi:MazG-like family protein [Enterococcus cecorum]|uniref:MazG-like family protein n=1 Tax=Enterococcus cecorum TaxID=44008 RepID=UPI001FAD7567|nr:MazG-like family protein [Enterococcus cecorum]MCJ0594267.1 MazG-like family protein [Enterococcus cecorum]
MEELIKNVEEWSKERNLDTADPNKQRLKLWEEFGELNAAIARDNRKDAIDAIGDMLVVMIIYKQQLGYGSNDVLYPRKDNVDLLSRLDDTSLIDCIGRGISVSQSCIEGLGMVVENLTVLAYRLNTNLEECLAAAYDVIKGRKGKMINGVFVKESDLNG